MKNQMKWIALLTTAVFIFLPLGLQADDEFWTAKPEKWSSVKIWSGSRDIKKDGSIRN